MTEQQQPADASTVPPCPKCGGDMWDNREGKRNPKAPDFKCKDRGCEGVIWPPRGAVGAAPGATPGASAASPSASAAAMPLAAPQPPTEGMPACPICGGAMWDDRTSKRNPRAPDFKCKNKPRERGGPGCEGVIWPPRDGSTSPYPQSAARRPSAPGGSSGGPSGGSQRSGGYDAPPPYDAPPHDDDDLPF